MPMYEITNVDKPDRDNRHEAIRHVQGPLFGVWTLAKAVAWAKISGNEFFVRNPLTGAAVRVGVVKGHGAQHDYLRSYADNTYTDNLLYLPPISALSLLMATGT